MALNAGYPYRVVAVDHDGLTLAEWLATRFRHSTLTEWQQRCEAGEVMVDERPAAADMPLRRGAEIVWSRPPWDEPDVPLHYRLCYEDESMIVVDKPAGLPTMPAGGFLEHTLLQLLRRRWADAAPTHRLGRYTSGLVVVARTIEAAAWLSALWRQHRVEKEYLAVAQGRPLFDDTEVTMGIGPVPHGRLGSVHAASPTGRSAHSHVEVVARHRTCFEGRVRITTGRPHQIRIHMAVLGHPLVGDPLYVAGGVPAPDTNALPGDGGYLLHATRVAFTHPRTGRLCEVVSPRPAEWDAMMSHA
jgi:23S rRNA pseudouridine1911/1915/1917 synthase